MTEGSDPRSASRRSSQVVPGSSKGGFSDAGRLLGAPQPPLLLRLVLMLHERKCMLRTTSLFPFETHRMTRD
ncbi:hypothetical protein V8C42DRAFT_314597 [Trichoderma barbatum]